MTLKEYIFSIPYRKNGKKVTNAKEYINKYINDFDYTTIKHIDINTPEKEYQKEMYYQLEKLSSSQGKYIRWTTTTIEIDMQDGVDVVETYNGLDEINELLNE